MKNLATVIIAMLTSLALAQGLAHQARPVEQEASEQEGFTRVKRIGEDQWRSFFMFSLSGHDYTIRGDGLAESGSRKARPHSFHLTLGQNGHLERVYFFEYEGDLVLVYEAGDQRSGWGYAERLDQRTLKTKWLTPISGYNIGRGLVEVNYAYLTAANLLAKIDLRSGSYIWQQEQLQNQYAPSFEGFRLPSLTGERVLFQEDAQKGRTIEIDKTTGKILNIRN